MAASVGAAALIWWQPSTAVVVVGFVILGAALVGVFPVIIANTPQRIGDERAQHASLGKWAPPQPADPASPHSSAS
jgi:hypothetical protein